MEVPLSCVLVVLETLEIIRIAGSPNAVILNARDCRAPTEVVLIVRVGRLGIRIKIVVLLVVIPGMVVKVLMTTHWIPMPVPTTNNSNGTIESLMKIGKESFLSQVIKFERRERTGRQAI